MKKIALFLPLFLTYTFVFAQEFKLKMDKIGNESQITFLINNSNVKIEGYSGQELIITASNFQAPPERAQGLKPLYATAVDNTNLGLSVTQNGNEWVVEKASRKDIDYTIKVPKQVRIKYEETNYQSGDVTVMNHEGDLEISCKSGDIRAENISGSVVMNTISGDINLIFNGLKQEKPCSIKAISGNVDITVPASAKANLKLRSVSGEAYSNCDIEFSQKENMNRVDGGNIDGKIGGGGVEFSINAISGDIYLRKK